MYEFCYDYIKLKYQNNVKLYCMDTDSFVIKIKTEYFFIKILRMMLKKSLIHQIQ